jgi:hypothetical protein
MLEWVNLKRRKQTNKKSRVSLNHSKASMGMEIFQGKA